MSADDVDRSALGRAAAARHRPARRARGAADRSGLGDLSVGLHTFATTVGRSRAVRRSLTSVTGRGVADAARPVPAVAVAADSDASVRAPRWWTPGPGGAPGLARVVRRVPTESTYTPGGFSGRLAPKAVPMRLPAEVAAAGPMLAPQDVRRRSAPRASSTPSAAGAVAAEGDSRARPAAGGSAAGGGAAGGGAAGAVQHLRRAAAAAAAGPVARQTEIRRSVTRGASSAPPPNVALRRGRADVSSSMVTLRPTVGSSVNTPASFPSTPDPAGPGVAPAGRPAATVWRSVARATSTATATDRRARFGREGGSAGFRSAPAADGAPGTVGSALGAADVLAVGAGSAGRRVWGRLASRVAGAMVWRSVAREDVPSSVAARPTAFGSASGSAAAAGHVEVGVRPGPGRSAGTAVGASERRRRGAAEVSGRWWSEPSRVAGPATVDVAGAASAGRRVLRRLASRVVGAMLWRTVSRDGRPGRGDALPPADPAFRTASGRSVLGVAGATGPAGGAASAPRRVWGGLAARVAGAVVWRSPARADMSGVGAVRALRLGLAAAPVTAAGGTGRASSRAAWPVNSGGFGAAASAPGSVWGAVASRAAGATVLRRVAGVHGSNAVPATGGGTGGALGRVTGPVNAGAAGGAASGPAWREEGASVAAATGAGRAIPLGLAAGPMVVAGVREPAGAAGGVRRALGRARDRTDGAAVVAPVPVRGAGAAGDAGAVLRRMAARADGGGAGAGRAIRFGPAGPVGPVGPAGPMVAAGDGGAGLPVSRAVPRDAPAAVSGVVAAGDLGPRLVARRKVAREGSYGPVELGPGSSGPGATLWRSVAREDAHPVTVGRGGFEAAPAALGRVLPGGPTRLPAAATTVFRSTQAAVAGVLARARTDRVAPPRMSVVAPTATLEQPPMPAGMSNGFAAETRQPGLGPLQPAANHPAAGHAAPTTHATPPADTAAPAPGPGNAPPSPPGGGAEPPDRWRLGDLDPADLAELADLVMERIEGRVRGELERRGRRGVPGVF